MCSSDLIELGAGRGSVFRVPEDVPRPVAFSGTIIAGPGCFFIDNGSERFLIEGSFVHGSEVAVTGLLAGSRIRPEQLVQITPDAETVLCDLRRFRESLQP